jgi:hypothetical protein
MGFWSYLAYMNLSGSLYRLQENLDERCPEKINSICAWVAAGRSPQLFVLAMEILTLLVVKAVDGGLLSQVARCAPKQRITIYADDIALFLKPKIQDLVVVRGVLKLFGEASGLYVNYTKLSAIVIRGEAEDMLLLKDQLRAKLDPFRVDNWGCISLYVR